MLGIGVSTESVAASLVDEITRAALWCVTGKAMGAPTAASVAALVKRTLRTMAMAKLYQFVSVGIVMGVIMIGGGTLRPTGGRPQAIATTVTDEFKSNDTRSDLDTIQSTWVRVSSDGRNEGITYRMVVKKTMDQPVGDAPPGAGWFVFEWI